MPQCDLAVVGAGIVGLSCALAAAQRGLRVVVIERDNEARGASVRNFGLVTVSGQPHTGAVWERARRSCAVWLDVADQAGIPLLSRGLWVTAQRAEAAAVLEAFMTSDSSPGCELWGRGTARQRCPDLCGARAQAVMWSPHELRVESRDAIPKLASWLEREQGVVFHWGTTVSRVDPPHLDTSRGPLTAAVAVVCPGDDRSTLFPERLRVAGVRRCQLRMMRLESPGFTLPGTVMSDLSLIRYGGFAELSEAGALRRRLEAEQPEYIRHGIHLIVAQSADGSLVVGDSHHYDGGHDPPRADPRIDRQVYALLEDEYHAATGCRAPPVRERWSGTYAVASERAVLIESPLPRVRLVVVTSGVGASTAFAIGEDVIGDLVN